MKSLKKLTMVLFLGLVLLAPGSIGAAVVTEESPILGGLIQEEAKKDAATKDAVTEKEVPKSDAKLQHKGSIIQKTTPDNKGLTEQSK
ncbi:MAG TPA: hypothetical protein DCG53_00550 [Syntrophus sp. (in: bacteria)]|nr:hypothetical protein [Syntrophus sp. (in: bacteria)]